MPRRKSPATTTEQRKVVADQIEPLTVGTLGRSLVFISHDSQDAQLAEAFANLLTDVSGGTLKSFRSSDKKGGAGIEFGAEWYQTIMSQIDSATDAVALLTQHSLDRPWILYEVGVARAKLDRNVMGVALGVPLERVSSGPFGQFQNCGDDEDSLTKLVTQLIKRNPDASPREEAIRREVKLFLAGLNDLLSAKGGHPMVVESDETNAAKLFEEVKAMIRELVARTEVTAKIPGQHRSLGTDAQNVWDYVRKLISSDAWADEQADAVWLVWVTQVRDSIPWLYELGMGFYRALATRDPKVIEEGVTNFWRNCQTVVGLPHFQDFQPSSSPVAEYLLNYAPKLASIIGDQVIRGASKKAPVIPTRVNKKPGESRY